MGAQVSYEVAFYFYILMAWSMDRPGEVPARLVKDRNFTHDTNEHEDNQKDSHFQAGLQFKLCQNKVNVYLSSPGFVGGRFLKRM